MSSRRIFVAFMFLVMSGLFAAPAAAKEWKAGDRVMAHWKIEKYWYPGRIQEVRGGQYVVVFDDGDKQLTDAADIGPEEIKVGDKVYGNFKRAGKYYPGKVTSRTGEQIHIKYDDGDEEDTTLASIRVDPADKKQ
jgi:hypothetical protein